jgi:hypothetical protein
MTTFSWLPLTSLTSLVVILGEILQGKFREVCHVNDMRAATLPDRPVKEMSF